MKPEDMRIAILEALGWNRASETTWYIPNGTGHHVELDCTPDWLEDLNAMHVAEIALLDDSRGAWDAYKWEIAKLLYPNQEPDPSMLSTAVVCAEAGIRAVAWLKVKGLWRDK